MAELPVTSYGRKVAGEKSRVVSLFLNLSIPGIGILYAGNLKKGLIFFISYVVLAIAMAAAYCVMIFSTVGCVIVTTAGEDISPDAVIESFGGALISSGVMVLICLIMIILMIVSMVLGYGMCKENNQLWIEYLENN